MKYIKIIIGIIFVVASLLKLLTLWGMLHISWLERISDEPWAVYGAPIILIIVGADLIYNGINGAQRK